MVGIYLTLMNKINGFLKIILFLFLFIAMGALTLQVIYRFVIDAPLSWSTELSRYLIIWITFIGASLAVRHQRLIKLEMLLNKMSTKSIRIIELFTSFISIAFYIILIIFGISMMETVSTQQSAALHLSMAIPYAAIPVGAFLMICNTLVVLFEPTKGED